MDRRDFLSTLGAMGSLGTFGAGMLLTWHAQATEWSPLAQLPLDTRSLRTDSARVFDLSVSSADPSATGVVLWTHIRSDAVRAGEPLYLQVALDERFEALQLQVQIAPSQITPERDHTISVDLDGQLPSSPHGGRFHYRFIYDGTVSRTGRCRTLPASGASVSRLKLGLLTCQDYTNGYYGALAHLSKDESIDVVLHLGDFIYESAGDPRFQSLPFADRSVVLPSGGTVALGLADYRAIYRRYRSDPNLQAAMERHTFICVPDDHETANDAYWDYARDTLGAPDHPFTKDPQYGNSPALLRQLKLDSQRAWSEYVPARVAFNRLATHPHEALKVYRQFRFGSFLDLFMIENRSYRSPHPCGEGDVLQRYVPVGCTKYNAPEQTLLGAAQRNWLIEGLTHSTATWKLMGNQTFFGRLALSFLGVPLVPFNVDAWDGFTAERRLLTGALREAKVRNFLVVTGDLHTFMASHIKHNYGNINPLDFDNFVGAEFMTPAVTSSNLGEMLGAKLTSEQRTALDAGPGAIGGAHQQPARAVLQQQPAGLFHAGDDGQPCRVGGLCRRQGRSRYRRGAAAMRGPAAQVHGHALVDGAGHQRLLSLR
ncbi:MAG: alkaline phosphatase D family protein [Aquabacterium sp.]